MQDHSNSSVITSPPPIEQLGVGKKEAVGFFAPFAGKGRKADTWAGLFDGLGDKAEQVLARVEMKLKEKQIPNLSSGFEVLKDQGIGVERRDYFIVKRGVATIALYIARFGTDLYISWDTFALGLISRVRVVIALILLVAPLLTCCLVPVLQAVISGGAYKLSQDLGELITGLSCLASPLYCILGVLVLISALLVPPAILATIYAALVDKDPLAVLRANISEFQQDDIIALEQAVHHSVLETLDEIGIESKLIPPATFEGVRRRLI